MEAILDRSRLGSLSSGVMRIRGHEMKVPSASEKASLVAYQATYLTSNQWWWVRRWIIVRPIARASKRELMIAAGGLRVPAKLPDRLQSGQGGYVIGRAWLTSRKFSPSHPLHNTTLNL
jgi:hypothetical protein